MTVCVEGGSFRPSRHGVGRCLLGLVVGGCVLEFGLVLRRVAWLTASKEAPLGRRVSECVVASRVWGLGSGCINLRWS